jgi:hypothetical protein
MSVKHTRTRKTKESDTTLCKIGNPDKTFEAHANNIIDLFRAAEQHVEARRLSSKIKEKMRKFSEKIKKKGK